MQTSKLDLYLTPKDLSELFGITVQGVHKFLKDNKFPTEITNSRHKIYPDVMRRILEFKQFPIPRLTIVIHIVKGGTGKTTLTHALASRASALGLRVLVIDGDQQANLSKSFGVYSRPRVDVTLLEVYNGRLNDRKVTIEDAVVKLTDFLHIIPANLGLANLDLSIIQGTENIGNFFNEMLAPIRNQYDLVFFDCPPSISRVTSAACCFADHVILPINADPYSIEGLQLSIEHLLAIHGKFNKSAQLSIVMNKFDARQKLAFSLLNQLMHSDFKEYLCDTYISTSKEFDNAIADGKCLWNSKAGKNPALEDVNSLLVEVLDLKQWAFKEKPEAEKTTVSILNEITQLSSSLL